MDNNYIDDDYLSSQFKIGPEWMLSIRLQNYVSKYVIAQDLSSFSEDLKVIRQIVNELYNLDILPNPFI